MDNNSDHSLGKNAKQERTPKNGRRHFIRDSGLMIAGGAIGTAVAASNAVQGSHAVHTGGDDRVRIAFVGCGRRARQLADAALSVSGASATGAVGQVVGLADAFADQTQAMYRSLKGRFKTQISDDCVRASGMNAYQQVLESDADLIYLTTPPFCRPQHFEAVIQAAKHVFLEKPLAADIAGLAQVNSTSKLAKQLGVSVHVGFQRRYDPRYQETIAKVHHGAIGQPLFARAFCNAGPLRRLTNAAKNRRETELEYQIRNWNHFQWTGGDFLLEQHVAGLDVVRWAIDQSPVMAQGQGGWGQLPGSQNLQGNNADNPTETLCASARSEEVFDHHSVEYEFTGGIHLMSHCRRVAKAWNETNEHLHGTAGRVDFAKAAIYDHDGKLLWRSKRNRDPAAGTLAQSSAVLSAIRSDASLSSATAGSASSGSASSGSASLDGSPAEKCSGAAPVTELGSATEFDSAVQSTLLAMMGHQASRTGKRVRWSNCWDKLVQNLT